MWENGQIVDLGELPGASNCTATAINKHGTIVGSCDVPGGGEAFLWRGGVMTPLGTLAGSSFSHALAVLNGPPSLPSSTMDS
jgi:probable HAF family extracellular repeat protein